MGKAIAVSAAMVLIIGIIALVVWLLNKKPPRGDLNSKQEYELEKLVHGAAGVIRNLGNAHNNIEDNDLLSDRSRQNVERWLNEYEKFKWERRELSA